MRIAVTGSQGFVGRQVVARWRAQGLYVVAVSRGPEAAPGPGQRSVPDYLDRSALARAFEGCAAVVHLAARAHVLQAGSPQAELAAFRQANVLAGVATAEAARQAGCTRFVLVSSIGVLGNSTAGRPFDDQSPPDPKELYARSKLEAEAAVQAALADGGPGLVILRPPLVYGPGCPGNLRQLLLWVQKMPVLPFAGLRRRRSFIGVDNLADALHLAATHPACAGRRHVVCDPEEVDLATLVAWMAEGLGQARKPRLAVPEPLLRSLAALAGRGASFDKLVAELRVDASGFAAATGWRAAQPLATGIRRMCEAFGHAEALPAGSLR